MDINQLKDLVKAKREWISDNNLFSDLDPNVYHRGYNYALADSIEYIENKLIPLLIERQISLLDHHRLDSAILKYLLHLAELDNARIFFENESKTSN